MRYYAQQYISAFTVTTEPT